MATIQWRPEVNALTSPQSYRVLFLPRTVVGTMDMAARMAAAMPNYSEKEFRAFIDLHNELIAESLINGEQVTEENAFSYSLSFSGRLENPDDPLPPLEECLNVRVRALPALVAAVRQKGKAERLAMEKKLPLITSAEDTVLGLKDILNPQGVLRLAGAHMAFDVLDPIGGSCVIAGTRNGKAVQQHFGKIANSEIILVPEIPAQANPWNNEYTISISTSYSKRGALRTGTYSRMLRSLLTISNLTGETGILTGKAGSPYVSIIGGTASAAETLRIQVVFESRHEVLLFNLLDLREGGKTGVAVQVTANGEYSLPGFPDSAVSSLNIRVNSYAALKDMVQHDYGGRLVDVLMIATA